MHKLKNGERVFVGEDGIHCKIARENGEVGRYFVGKAAEFRALLWDTYNTTAKGAYVFVPFKNLSPCSFACTCCEDRRKDAPPGENLGFFSGPAINPDPTKTLPVQVIYTLESGEKVYVAQHGSSVKMVSESGEPRYFTGALWEFRASQWSSYTKMAAKGYVYTPPLE